MLSMKELFEHGRTLIYSELPEALWAATGYRIKKSDAFLKFGTLRNGLVHFAAPEFNAAAETLKFAFEVMDPIARDFWDESFIEYAQDWDDVIISDGYLSEQINQAKLKVHPDTRKEIKKIEKQYDA